MRAIVMAAGLAALVSSTASAASLASCRGMVDRDARLDCYDNIAAAPVEAASVNSAGAERFDGAYAGVSAHFGGANENMHSYDWWSGGERTFRLNAPSFGGFVGYNQSVGDMVLGVEASLRADTTGREAFFASSKWDAPLPRLAWSGSGWYGPSRGSGVRYDIAGPYTVASSYQTSTSVRELATPMFSARAGVGVGDFLLYGRGGLGASYMQIKTMQDSSETRCANTLLEIEYTPWSERATHIECLNASTTAVSETTKSNRLVPTFSAAVGAEYHHDKYFGRIEAEARYIHWGNTFLPSEEGGTMRYQVGIGAGIKF